MNCYYSLLKISVNPNLDDEITVGMVLLTDQRYWYKYSEDILKQIKPLIPGNFNGLERTLKIINRKVDSLGNSQLDLYNAINPFFNESFLQTLAVQNTGLIRFSIPRPIVLTHVNNDIFDALFENILGPFKKKKIRRKNKDKVIITNQLIKPLADDVHTGITLRPNDIEGLYFNFPLECLGMNRTIGLVKYMDFRQTPQTLDMKVMHLLYINDLLKKIYKKKTQIYVLASEPLKPKTKAYRIFHFMNENDDIEIKDPEAASIVARMFLENGMKKFLDNKS
jgi:hypothetical protein